MTFIPPDAGLRKVALAIAVGLLAASWLPPGTAQTQTVSIYSPLHEITLSNLTRVFYTSTGQTVEFVRMPMSEIMTRVAAERGLPRADVILGLSSPMHEELKNRGALERYLSPVRAEILPTFRDPDGYWTGTTVHVQGIVVNVERFRREVPGVRFPRTYDDLLDLRFKGHIVAPNPVTSAAGFTFVIAQMSRLGEERAWEYLAALDRNVRFYTTGSATPPNAVAAGEFLIGISYAHDAMLVLADGRPIRFLYPPKAGWDVTAVSLIRNASNLEGGQRFIDWVLSRRPLELMTKISLAYPARVDVPLPRGVVPLKDLDLVSYDAKSVAVHRDRIIREWARRFGSNAAGK